MEYTIVLLPWEEGSGYTVIVPAIPGCITQGATKEEALTNARDAIRCHIEGLKKAGKAVPVEESKPELSQIAIQFIMR